MYMWPGPVYLVGPFTLFRLSLSWIIIEPCSIVLSEDTYCKQFCVALRLWKQLLKEPLAEGRESNKIVHANLISGNLLCSYLPKTGKKVIVLLKAFHHRWRRRPWWCCMQVLPCWNPVPVKSGIGYQWVMFMSPARLFLKYTVDAAGIDQHLSIGCTLSLYGALWRPAGALCLFLPNLLEIQKSDVLNKQHTANG